MSTLIPGSAFKFYAENTHTTVVNGGAAPGQTLYPKLGASFIEDYTGLGLTLSMPFAGRGVLTANKTFTEGAETKGFVASLVGTESLNIDLDMQAVLGWSGVGVVDVDALSGSVLVPKSAGTLTITLEGLNSRKFKITPTLQRGTFLGGNIDEPNGAIHLDIAAGDVVNEVVVPSDFGYVKDFILTLEISFPENTTTDSIGCGLLDIFNGIGGQVVTGLVITQDGQAISVSPSSITINPTTGIGSSPVSVVAQGVWTVA